MNLQNNDCFNATQAGLAAINVPVVILANESKTFFKTGLIHTHFSYMYCMIHLDSEEKKVNISSKVYNYGTQNMITLITMI